MVNRLLNTLSHAVNSLTSPVHAMMRNAIVRNAEPKHIEQILEDHANISYRDEPENTRWGDLLSHVIIENLDSSTLTKPLVLRGLDMDQVTFKNSDLSNVVFMESSMTGITFEDDCKNPPEIDESCKLKGLWAPAQWMENDTFRQRLLSVEQVTLSSPVSNSYPATYEATEVPWHLITPTEDGDFVLNGLNGELGVEINHNAMLPSNPSYYRIYNTVTGPSDPPAGYRAFISPERQYSAMLNGAPTAISGEELIERIEQEIQHPHEPYTPSLDVQLTRHEMWLESGGAFGQQLDLTGQRIEGKSLQGRLLAHAKLQETTFVDCDISQTSFEGCDLTNTTFSECDMKQVNMTHTYSRGLIMENCMAEDLDLRNATMRDALVEQSTFVNPDMRFSDLTDSTFRRCLIEGPDNHDDPTQQIVQPGFQRANLSGVTFEDTSITNENFNYVSAEPTEKSPHSLNLKYSSITGSMMQEMSVPKANIIGTDIAHSILVATDMSHSNIQSANFVGNSAASLDLDGSTLFGTQFYGTLQPKQDWILRPSLDQDKPGVILDNATVQDCYVSDATYVKFSTKDATITDTLLSDDHVYQPEPTIDAKFADVEITTDNNPDKDYGDLPH